MYLTREQIPDDLVDFFEPAECGECFVCALVQVFREVRRVLRDDGCVWLNLGDSYAGNGRIGRADSASLASITVPRGVGGAAVPSGGANGKAPQGPSRRRMAEGIKEKDLIGVPWLVAFALRADGWYLRSAVTWCKESAMPESVRDRPTTATEMVFLLTKRPAYYFDAVAVQTPTGANIRNWWVVNSEPFSSERLGLGETEHFAVFPSKLVEPCVLAGSAARACGVCGAPWRRVVERAGWPDPENVADDQGRMKASGHAATDTQRRKELSGARHRAFKAENPDRFLGWEPSCTHDGDTGRSVVLDPFAGSGTVGVVCGWHGRDFIGIELNESYARMARERIALEGRPGGRPASHEPARVNGHPSLFDGLEG